MEGTGERETTLATESEGGRTGEDKAVRPPLLSHLARSKIQTPANRIDVVEAQFSWASVPIWARHAIR